MRFDYTHGNKAKYMVSLYGFNVEDHYYCDTYKGAKAVYDGLLGASHAKGTVLSLSDLTKDVRKEFKRF